MRVVRAALIALVVLVGLGVAADFGAAAAAEYQGSKRMRAELGLPADPSVRINGFPFLTQAASGTYREVEVAAAGVAVGPLRDVGVEATLRDVEAPLGDLLGGDVRRVPVGSVDGAVRVRERDLGRAIGLADLRIETPAPEELTAALGTDAPGPGDAARAGVRLLATTDLLGERVAVRSLGLVELVDGVVRLTAGDLVLDGGGELPTIVASGVLSTLSTEIDPGALPFTVTPTAVKVESGAFTVEGTVDNIPLDEGNG